ncbi:MAG: 50S ribosomal protein L11 [Nanoarchaeota archaeon]|nr:50S ribosomal protein L11 [Nanoarchaeota archaeon]MBU1321996.1 50S ribosomal protein L11 [Nanoarchaeota archaeon]MBU1597970.1 50S ribosomal protein L11 [Nanoarchaeota archaeon]MBU2442338.1 50S ribosomal protein L11 [Nanoarchaeota archaeon]
MPKETVDALIEGGKASAAPPLGPALGPKGVNIGQVVAEINKKTASFNGMQVPVKVTIDTDTKEFTISIGTPPAAGLIKKAAGIKKATGNPLEHVADLKIEQIIKIAKMKEDALTGKDLKAKVKEIIGTCNSMGIKVEEMHGTDALKAVDAGKFDKEIKEEKTELSAAELKEVEEEKKRMQEELALKKDEFIAKGKSIMAEMEGKESKEIRKAMEEAGLPSPIVQELVPTEKEAPGAKPGAAKPEAGAAPAGGAKKAAPAKK